MASDSAVIGLNRVGRIDLRDLAAISGFYGRDFVPYPFMIRDSSHRGPQGEDRISSQSAPDRFNHGDLRVFRPWFTTYMSADIRAECNIQYLNDGTLSLRMLAHRCGESGFLAMQHLDDTVEVFTVSPYELGGALAASSRLLKPGREARIVIPEYVPTEQRPIDNAGRLETFSVPVVVARGAARISESRVAVFATVQSQWRPARDWGFDRNRDAVVWLRIDDDGDYIYVPDYSHAAPTTARGLRDAIDRLMGEDLKQLLQFRRG